MSDKIEKVLGTIAVISACIALFGLVFMNGLMMKAGVAIFIIAVGTAIIIMIWI